MGGDIDLVRVAPRQTYPWTPRRCRPCADSRGPVLGGQRRECEPAPHPTPQAAPSARPRPPGPPRSTPAPSESRPGALLRPPVRSRCRSPPTPRAPPAQRAHLPVRLRRRHSRRPASRRHGNAHLRESWHLPGDCDRVRRRGRPVGVEDPVRDRLQRVATADHSQRGQRPSRPARDAHSHRNGRPRTWQAWAAPPAQVASTARARPPARVAGPLTAGWPRSTAAPSISRYSRGRHGTGDLEVHDGGGVADGLPGVDVARRFVDVVAWADELALADDLPGPGQVERRSVSPGARCRGVRAGRSPAPRPGW